MKPMLALGLASCIDPPTLKSCAEFPLGTAGCPSPCVLFCDLMVDNCKETLGQTGGDAQESCVAACDEGLRTRGTVGDLEGNTLDCRVTHARLAATEPAHCAAAAIEAGPEPRSAQDCAPLSWIYGDFDVTVVMVVLASTRSDLIKCSIGGRRSLGFRRRENDWETSSDLCGFTCLLFGGSRFNAVAPPKCCTKAVLHWFRPLS